MVTLTSCKTGDRRKLALSRDDRDLFEQRIIVAIFLLPLLRNHIIADQPEMIAVVAEYLYRVLNLACVVHVIEGAVVAKVVFEVDPRAEAKPTFGHEDEWLTGLRIHGQICNYIPVEVVRAIVVD